MRSLLRRSKSQNTWPCIQSLHSRWTHSVSFKLNQIKHMHTTAPGQTALHSARLITLSLRQCRKRQEMITNKIYLFHITIFLCFWKKVFYVHQRLYLFDYKNSNNVKYYNLPYNLNVIYSCNAKVEFPAAIMISIKQLLTLTDYDKLMLKKHFLLSIL